MIEIIIIESQIINVPYYCWFIIQFLSIDRFINHLINIFRNFERKKKKKKKSNLRFEGEYLEDELESEDCSEEHVEYVQPLGVRCRLVVELHGQGDRVDHDEDEDDVLELGRRHEPPYAVLYPVLWYVPPDRLRLEREVYAVSLRNGNYMTASEFKKKDSFGILLV